jgi:hypothetical protein
VCIAFFAVVAGGSYPITVDVQAGRQFAPPATIPPPNVIPTAVNNHDNPILLSRAQHGSPLAGTVLAEVADPQSEQELFVAALEKAASDSPAEPPHAPASLEPTATEPTSARNTDDLIIQHLYEMASADEAAGNFDRADEWRARARLLREPADASLPAIAPATGL